MIDDVGFKFEDEIGIDNLSPPNYSVVAQKYNMLAPSPGQSSHAGISNDEMQFSKNNPIVFEDEPSRDDGLCAKSDGPIKKFVKR